MFVICSKLLITTPCLVSLLFRTLSAMNLIIPYIEELLYDHDFVVIPSFGGFVAGYQAARLTTEGSIYPAQKEISFNTNVQYNDGLLVQTIMEKQQISFSQATSLLHATTNEWRRVLHLEGSLQFGVIGTFSLSATGVLSFTPAFANDFLSVSFGFHPFYFPQVIEESTRPIEPDVADNVVLFTPQSMSWSSTVRYVVASAAVILLFVLFPVNLTNIPIDYQASICGYRFSPTVTENALPQTDTTYVDVSEQKSPELLVEKQSSPIVPKITPPQERFYIVIGSFQTEQMAQRFVSELPAAFQLATIVFSENRYRITTASFDTEQDGEFFLQTFHQNHPRYKDAWLLKK